MSEIHLSNIQAWHIRSTMALRLRYRGVLPPAGSHSSRKNEKHEIRRQLHKQIKKYMDDPSLQAFLLSTSQERKWIGKFQFQPIICRRPPLTCEIEVRISTPVLFGSVLEKQGDLDSRIKTLFDALRPPEQVTDLPDNAEPGEDESLIYVLLQDDSLITDLIIKTEIDFTKTFELKHPEEHPEIELDIYVRLRNPYDIIVS